MVIPFTSEQFHSVFRDYNIAVWPMQWLLVGIALVAAAALLWPRPWSSVAVSAILGFLWAWSGVAYHLAFFARISPPAYAFAALSLVGAGVFVWQGVVQRRLTFQWADGPKAVTGTALIAFALVIYPVWSVFAGDPYLETATFGLPCPTTIFTIGVMCFAASPTPRSALIVPLLWCLVGAQAAFLLDVPADLSLIVTALVAIGLLASAGKWKSALKKATLKS